MQQHRIKLFELRSGIDCRNVDATLIHEAAIGRIAGEQIMKLQTLGLTAEEAEEKILEGFLR